MKAALLNAGFKFSPSHTGGESFKVITSFSFRVVSECLLAPSDQTNATSSVIWDVLRSWEKTSPVKNRDQPNSPASVILSKEPSFIADFTPSKELLRSEKEAKEVKKAGEANFVPAPTGWGPKARATGSKRYGRESPPNQEIVITNR